ncbi:MAG TPA: DUF5009 domain-containing protein [Planctomycetaceae bacterium]|nr:DUF5009 domain-containing protein [Planctomycetaceae bacterium]
MSTVPTRSRPAEPRLISLDAYRGFVMICLAANGFGLAATAKNFPDSPFWKAVGYQFEHVPWTGCAFWDLIQPSFMFMVGVSLPYSYAKRDLAGDSYASMLSHAIVRAIVLVLLGIGLSSNWDKHTNFTFMNVLTQIGLGYVFLFLLWNRPVWLQATVAAVILAGYWAWFAMWPLPLSDLDWSRYAMAEKWDYLSGFQAHWQIHTNPAAEFDRWFLNLFPRDKEFVFNKGGYQTLNFIPSLVTMLFGLMTGSYLREARSRTEALGWLVGCGLLLLVAGWAWHHFGGCPLVKRIWTPSWTLFSTGWTLLLLSAFYGVIDVLGWRAWSFPLVVAGMNSILLYLMGQLLRGWTRDTLLRHFGDRWPNVFGSQYEPLVTACAVLAVFWLTVYWLHRQRLYVRI